MLLYDKRIFTGVGSIWVNKTPFFLNIINWSFIQNDFNKITYLLSQLLRLMLYCII